jgi:hypothetical protein
VSPCPNGEVASVSRLDESSQKFPVSSAGIRLRTRYRSPAPAPDDRNAFVLYRQAAQRFRDMTEAEGNSFSNANLEWGRADASFLAWVAEHDEAISLLCAGAALPKFFVQEPRDVTVQPVVTENNVLAVRFSWIGTAGLFKAGRLREGDPTDAWTLLNAIIRASRHLEWAVPIVNGRSTGIGLVQYARQPVTAWANDLRWCERPTAMRPSHCRPPPQRRRTLARGLDSMHSIA